MAWLSRNNFTPSDFVHASDMNNLANDQQTWGGPVNGGGYVLSNVILEGVTTQAAGAVSSVFGRTGDVVAAPGDYSVSQITGAVPNTVQVIAGAGLSGGGALTGNVTLTAAVSSVFGRVGAITLTPADISGATGVIQTRQINTGTGLSGGGALSSDLNLAVVPDTVNQQVQVLEGATLVSTRHAINFISGANVSVSISDNGPSNRCDITISSTGGAGGMVDPTTTVGDLIVRGPSAVNRLGVGPNGQVLTADSTQPTGVKWAAAAGGGAVASVFGRTGVVTAASGDYTAAQVLNAVSTAGSYSDPPWLTGLNWAKILNQPAFLADPTTTKGDLIVHGAALTRLAVGADGSVLTADSTQPVGVRWGGLPVTSVFGRSGAITGQAGDYTAAQVTGAVANTTQVIAGTGLTGGGPLNANVTLNVVPQSMVQLINAYQGGLLIDTMPGINFIAGTNVTLSVVKNTTNNWTDVTINSAGTGGGSGQNQTPWLQNINAAGFSLNSTSGIGIGMVAGAAPLQITTIATAPDSTIITTPYDTNSLMGVAFRGAAREAGFVFAPTTFSNAPFVNLAAIYSTADIAILKAGSANDSAAVEHMRVTATGRVGIANKAPAYPLDVTGDMNLTGGVYRVNGTPISTGGAQTPWTSDISGGGFALSNVRYVAIGAATVPASPAIGLAVQGSTGLTAVSVNETTSSGQGGLTIINDAAQSTIYMQGSAGASGNALTLANSSSNGPILFSANGAERMRIAAGNVGIGNTVAVTPSGDTQIHLVVGSVSTATIGEITACGNTSTNTAWAGAFQVANYAITAADKRIAAIGGYVDGAVNNGGLLFATAPGTGGLAERMRITAAGLVGIGTTSPQKTLDVLSASNIAAIISCSGSAGAVGMGSYQSAALIQAYTDHNATQQANLSLNGTGGNVGIGTTSPAESLSFAASANISLAGFFTQCGIYFRDNFSPNGSNHAPGDLANLSITTRAGTGFPQYFGALAINATDGIYFTTNATDRMVVTPAGLVGIGTASPFNMLTVAGGSIPSSSANAGGAAFSISAQTGGQTDDNLLMGVHLGDYSWIQAMKAGSATRNLALNPQGSNVGIGTTSPQRPLHLAGPGSAPQFQIGVDGNPNYGLQFTYTNPNAGIQAFNNNVGSILMLNANGGNVGIGVTNPRGGLTIVAGTPATAATARQLTIGEGTNNPAYDVALGYGNLSVIGWAGILQANQNSVSAPLLLNPSGGCVGIGTSAPSTSYPLHVQGDCNITGAYRVNGTPIATSGITTQTAPGRALNTVYQNSTGKPMWVSVSATPSAGTGLTAKTDGGNPPGTTVALGGVGSYTTQIAFFVLPGNYYEVLASSAALNQWTEWY